MDTADERAELAKRLKLYKKHRWWENQKHFRREDPLRIEKKDLLERLQICAGLSEALAAEYTEQVYDEILEKLSTAFTRIKKQFLAKIEACDNSIKKEKQRLRSNHDEFMAVIIENKLEEFAKTGEALRQGLIDLTNEKDQSLSVVEDVFSDSEISWRKGDLPEFLSRQKAKVYKVRISAEGNLKDLFK